MKMRRKKTRIEEGKKRKSTKTRIRTISHEEGEMVKEGRGGGGRGADGGVTRLTLPRLSGFHFIQYIKFAITVK